MCEKLVMCEKHSSISSFVTCEMDYSNTFFLFLIYCNLFIIIISCSSSSSSRGIIIYFEEALVTFVTI